MLTTLYSPSTAAGAAEQMVLMITITASAEVLEDLPQSPGNVSGEEALPARQTRSVADRNAPEMIKSQISDAGRTTFRLG